MYVESQGTKNSQNNLEKVRGFILPDFKTYYRRTIIKADLRIIIHRSMEQK